MRTLKKLLSVILCVAIVFGCLSCMILSVAASSYNAQTVVSLASQQVDAAWENNMCLGYIMDLFYRAYGFLPRDDARCCAYHNGNCYLDSASREMIPLGSCVYFAGSDVQCYGDWAGHIAVYVGNDNIIHAWDGRIICTSIDYVINCGYSYRGYGWYADKALYVECSHNYILSESAPNCTQEGIRTYTCSSCGDTYSEPIEALGHNYIGVTTDATCSVGAHTTYTCSRCSDSYVEMEDSWSEWSTEYPADVAPDLIEQKTQYSALEKEYTTSTSDMLDGWTSCGTTYSDWGAVQTTNAKPTESDTLRITNTAQTGWGYFHWCNNYDDSGSWGIDSVDSAGASYYHSYVSATELPQIAFPDLGGQPAYGGTGSGAAACAYNFYIWFRNTGADEYTYSYQTRSEVNQFYRWSNEWSAWSDEIITDNENCRVKTQTVYRYPILKEHEYVCTEKAPTFTEKGFVTNTCAICGKTVTEEIPCLKGEVAQWNIALRENFEVKFHLDVSERIVSTAKVKLIIGENTATHNVSQLEKTEDGYYLLRAKISAAQMNDFIIVMVMNGREAASITTYTVREYCDAILADDAYSKYHTLVREMLNYGAMAQKYFSYDTENLANEGIAGAAASNVPESTEEVTVTGKIPGIHFYGASLVYRDRIAVRYYFAGDVSGKTFAANGKSYTPVEKDGMYYIEIADIMPQDLDQQIMLTVTDREGKILAVTYGPMNYMVRMNQKDDPNLNNLLKALYNYHLAAKALHTSL